MCVSVSVQPYGNVFKTPVEPQPSNFKKNLEEEKNGVSQQVLNDAF